MQAQTKLSILSTEHATIAESQADLLKTQALQDTKLQDSYASSERLEKELSEQIETLENTRESLREAEKTSRELQKRLNDQVRIDIIWSCMLVL